MIKQEHGAGVVCSEPGTSCSAGQVCFSLIPFPFFRYTFRLNSLSRHSWMAGVAVFLSMNHWRVTSLLAGHGAPPQLPAVTAVVAAAATGVLSQEPSKT